MKGHDHKLFVWRLVIRTLLLRQSVTSKEIVNSVDANDKQSWGSNRKKKTSFSLRKYLDEINTVHSTGRTDNKIYSYT